MRFTLVLDFTGMTYYGGTIPNTPFPPDPRIEEYQFEESDEELLCNEFMDSVNDYCDTLVDDGDVEYFNKDKCILLKTWLKEQLNIITNERLKELYTKLLEYASRAIELNTGVVIEL